MDMIFTHGIRRLIPAAVFMATLALTGCGAATGDVSGTVTFKGKPLPGGSVMFLDNAGMIHQAAIQENGKYEVQGIPVGEAKVAVAYVDDKINDYAKAVAGRNRGMQKSAPIPKIRASSLLTLPERYSQPDQSGLATTVAEGVNSFDITIQ